MRKAGRDRTIRNVTRYYVNCAASGACNLDGILGSFRASREEHGFGRSRNRRQCIQGLCRFDIGFLGQYLKTGTDEFPHPCPHHGHDERMTARCSIYRDPAVKSMQRVPCDVQTSVLSVRVATPRVGRPISFGHSSLAPSIKHGMCYHDCPRTNGLRYPASTASKLSCPGIAASSSRV